MYISETASVHLGLSQVYGAPHSALTPTGLPDWDRFPRPIWQPMHSTRRPLMGHVYRPCLPDWLPDWAWEICPNLATLPTHSLLVARLGVGNLAQSGNPADPLHSWIAHVYRPCLPDWLPDWAEKSGPIWQPCRPTRYWLYIYSLLVVYKGCQIGPDFPAQSGPIWPNLPTLLTHSTHVYRPCLPDWLPHWAGKSGPIWQPLLDPHVIGCQIGAGKSGNQSGNPCLTHSTHGGHTRVYRPLFIPSHKGCVVFNR